MPSAATRVFETADVRRLIVDHLDWDDLGRFARVQKKASYDVAQKLYCVVTYGMLAHMSRQSERRAMLCDAVREIDMSGFVITPSLARAVPGFDRTDKKRLCRMSRFYIAGLIVPLVDKLVVKCPNLRRLDFPAWHFQFSENIPITAWTIDVDRQGGPPTVKLEVNLTTDALPAEIDALAETPTNFKLRTTIEFDALDDVNPRRDWAALPLRLQHTVTSYDLGSIAGRFEDLLAPLANAKSMPGCLEAIQSLSFDLEGDFDLGDFGRLARLVGQSLTAVHIRYRGNGPRVADVQSMGDVISEHMPRLRRLGISAAGIQSDYKGTVLPEGGSQIVAPLGFAASRAPTDPARLMRGQLDDVVFDNMYRCFDMPPISSLDERYHPVASVPLVLAMGTLLAPSGTYRYLGRSSNDDQMLHDLARRPTHEQEFICTKDLDLYDVGRPSDICQLVFDESGHPTPLGVANLLAEHERLTEAIAKAKACAVKATSELDAQQAELERQLDDFKAGTVFGPRAAMRRVLNEAVVQLDRAKKDMSLACSGRSRA